MKQLKDKNSKYIISIMYIIYFISCLLLFYRQSIEYGGKYESDLILHIEFGLTGQDNYSIVYIIYGFLYRLFNNTWLIAGFLAVVTVATVKVTAYVYKFLFKTKNIEISYFELNILAFISTFVMSIYIPHIYEFSYYGTLSGQAWHNSTYLLMRILGLWILIIYFKIDFVYLSKGVNKKAALLFSGLLILINAVKPNFFLAFAPFMAIRLFLDLINGKGDILLRLKRIVVFGSCVLPSVLVLLIQNQIIYGGNSGNGIAVDIGYTISKVGHPVFKVFVGLAFPLFVLVVKYREIIQDRIYGSICGIWGVSFLEYVFLIETGFRKNHENFAWGMMFGTYILFVVSIYKFIHNYKEIRAERNLKLTERIYFMLGCLLLLCHVLSGLYYFAHLLLGGRYGI